MNSKHEEEKSQLLKIKKLIDETIKNKGLIKEIIKYETQLKDIKNKIAKLNMPPQDKRFICFNYYSALSCIYLAKSWQYKAFESFLKALNFYLEYIENLQSTSRWNFDYYFNLSKQILNKKIELFGSTSVSTFDNIFENLKEVANTLKGVTLSENLKNSALNLITDIIFRVISQSSELYESHLERAGRLIGYIDSFNDKIEERFPEAKGTLESARFMLLKKKLHFNLRKMIPSSSSTNGNISGVQVQIKEIIEEAERVSNLETKWFKKSKSPQDKRIKFKCFLADLDRHSIEYYKNLWIHGNFLGAFKDLGEIFSCIRSNINLIVSHQIISHFIREYEMLVNYFKLYLLIRDFEDFQKKDYVLIWQKEVASKTSEDLKGIAKRYFKYMTPKSLGRNLLVVEKAASGKFIEFVVFYLLKEFIEKNVDLSKYLQGNSNEAVTEFFRILSGIKDKEKIKWGYRIERVSSDIDIFIEISNNEKYGLFIKSGVLSSDDFKKIREEIFLAKQIKLNKTFIVIDIAKNLRFILNKQKNKLEDNIILIDLGEFLNFILEIVKQEEDIDFELSRSEVLTYAGVYS